MADHHFPSCQCLSHSSEKPRSSQASFHPVHAACTLISFLFIVLSFIYIFIYGKAKPFLPQQKTFESLFGSAPSFFLARRDKKSAFYFSADPNSRQVRISFFLSFFNVLLFMLLQLSYFFPLVPLHQNHSPVPQSIPTQLSVSMGPSTNNPFTFFQIVPNSLLCS